jgi:hypothetical protein
VATAAVAATEILFVGVSVTAGIVSAGAGVAVFVETVSVAFVVESVGGVVSLAELVLDSAPDCVSNTFGAAAFAGLLWAQPATAPAAIAAHKPTKIVIFMEWRSRADCTEMGHRASSWTLGRFPWQLFSFIVCG